MNADEALLRDLLTTWTTAEVAGDTATLDRLADESFVLVGPAGFVLDKPQWLERYRSGSLVTDALDLAAVTPRFYGSTAVSVSIQTQVATYDSHPAGGSFRTTHLAVRDDDGRWHLASQHLSPLVRPDMAPAGS